MPRLRFVIRLSQNIGNVSQSERGRTDSSIQTIYFSNYLQYRTYPKVLDQFTTLWKKNRKHLNIDLGLQTKLSNGYFKDSSVIEIYCISMDYKLKFRKCVYNLVGQVPKAQIIRLFKKQNVLGITIYLRINKCEECLPCLNRSKNGRLKLLTEHGENQLDNRKFQR